MPLKDKIYVRRVPLESCGELRDKTVAIRRVAKVVKGGRRFGFSAFVVTGDGAGSVGYGLGKASEVPEAIRKGAEAARKNLVRIPLRGTTIPYEVIGKSGATQVVLKVAMPGTGVIAGSAVRAVVEAVGIKDILTKVIGSTNPSNALRAVFDGLLQIREPEVIAAERRMTLEDIGYRPV